jgi:hypothetical protein
MDLCVESLLSILQFVISFRFSADSLDFAKSVHLLLGVFDEIIALSRNTVIDEFIITIMIEREDVFRYFKTYVGQLWLNKDVVNVMEDKGKDLEEFRLRTIIHSEVTFFSLFRCSLFFFLSLFFRC